MQLSNWAAIGDWRLMFLDRDRVRTATVADAQRTALEYFKTSNRTVGLFIPGEPDRAEIPPRPDVTAMLQGYKGDEARAEGEAFDPTPANIDSRTSRVELPNGIKLVMLPKETRGDSVNALIRLNYGDENSLKGVGRFGGLMTPMMMRGTRERSRQEIQDELARLQSQLGIGGGSGLTTANIQSTRENLAATLELAIEVLREPAFPEAELATLKDQMLAGIESQRSEPQSIVSRAYARHWARNYSADDVRYPSTIDEDVAFITRATVADLRALHSGFLGATQAEIVVVGDFDADAIRTLLTEGLGDWRSPKPASDVLNLYSNLATDPDDAGVRHAGQGERVLLGRYADRDARLACRLSRRSCFGNYILGSGPASRLFGRIRGREGLSYGVGSGFGASPRSDGATFTVNAISAPQNASASRGLVPRRARQRAARRLHRGRVRAGESQLGATAPSRAHAGRRRGRHARSMDSRRPHDGLGRRVRSQGPGVDRRADARRDAAALRREQDDVHARRGLRGPRRVGSMS